MYIYAYIYNIYIYTYIGVQLDIYRIHTQFQPHSHAEIHDKDVLRLGTVWFEIEEELASKVLCTKLNIRI